MNSVDVRTKLVEALRLDLVGPGNDHAFARELLPESPSRWYLTGFLVPVAAPAEQRSDETSTEVNRGTDKDGAKISVFESFCRRLSTASPSIFNANP